MVWGAAAGMQAPMLKDNVTGRPGQLLMATGIQESIARGRALAPLGEGNLWDSLLGSLMS